MEGLIADDVTSAYVSIQISGSSGGENVKKKKKKNGEKRRKNTRMCESFWSLYNCSSVELSFLQALVGVSLAWLGLALYSKCCCCAQLMSSVCSWTDIKHILFVSQSQVDCSCRGCGHGEWLIVL